MIINSQLSITQGGGGGGWQPNADMKWAKTACENDIQAGFTYKMLIMISNGYKYTNISVPTNGAVKTSDGGYYTANATHTWDDTNARTAESHSNMKLRWIIYYYDREEPTISLLSDSMYICFDGVKFGKIFATSSASNVQMLEYFDIINGANLKSSVTDMSYMFNNCRALQTIPLIDTSNVTNMSYMFNMCYALQTIPLIDTSSATNMSYMFQNCFSLQTIPLIDTSSATNMAYMFANCYALQTIPLIDTNSATSMNSMFTDCYALQTIPLIDTSSAINTSFMFNKCFSLQAIPLLDTSSATSMIYMFAYCYALQTIPLIDTSSATNIGSMFQNCSSLQTATLNLNSATNLSNLFSSCSYLEYLTLTNIKKSLSISASTKYSHDTLLAIVNALTDLTGGTAQTLTMGSTNLAKLYSEEIAIATNKNWTLA